MVRGRKLPAQRELQREVDHLDQAEQAAKVASLRALHMAVSMGAPVEFVVRISTEEFTQPIYLKRTVGENYIVDGGLEIVSTCSGDIRDTAIRLAKGSYEFPVKGLMSEPGTVRLGDVLHIYTLRLEFHHGDDT